MSNRTVQKQKRLGFALSVKMPNEEKLTRVGFLFMTRREAEVWREIHYPTTRKFTITGVRVNVEKASTFVANESQTKGVST